MILTFPVSVATWMVERLSPTHVGEALAGDLLEELHNGRSTNWYCRQAAAAIAQALAAKLRPHAAPLIYATAWSIAFPRCFAERWQQLLPSELGRWAALDWPYSSLLVIGGELLPAVSCVWLGLLTYLLMSRRTEAGHAPLSLLRLAESLSVSLSVLLLLTALILWSGNDGGLGPHRSPEQGIYLLPYRPATSLPLLLSLWSALTCALRRPQPRTGTPSAVA